MHGLQEDEFGSFDGEQRLFISERWVEQIGAGSKTREAREGHRIGGWLLFVPEDELIIHTIRQDEYILPIQLGLSEWFRFIRSGGFALRQEAFLIIPGAQ